MSRCCSFASRPDHPSPSIMAVIPSRWEIIWCIIDEGNITYITCSSLPPPLLLLPRSSSSLFRRGRLFVMSAADSCLGFYAAAEIHWLLKCPDRSDGDPVLITAPCSAAHSRTSSKKKEKKMKIRNAISTGECRGKTVWDLMSVLCTNVSG